MKSLFETEIASTTLASTSMSVAFFPTNCLIGISGIGIGIGIGLWVARRFFDKQNPSDPTGGKPDLDTDIVNYPLPPEADLTGGINLSWLPGGGNFHAPVTGPGLAPTTNLFNLNPTTDYILIGRNIKLVPSCKGLETDMVSSFDYSTSLLYKYTTYREVPFLPGRRMSYDILPDVLDISQCNMVFVRTLDCMTHLSNTKFADISPKQIVESCQYFADVRATKMTGSGNMSIEIKQMLEAAMDIPAMRKVLIKTNPSVASYIQDGMSVAAAKAATAAPILSRIADFKPATVILTLYAAGKIPGGLKGLEAALREAKVPEGLIKEILKLPEDVIAEITSSGGPSTLAAKYLSDAGVKRTESGTPSTVSDDGEYLETILDLFQDPASVNLEVIIKFNVLILNIIIFLIILIFWLVIFIKLTKPEIINSFNLFYNEDTETEKRWTISPATVLLLTLVPSFIILRIVEGHKDPLMVVKISGHQWFWAFEINNKFMSCFNNINLKSSDFCSYILPSSFLKEITVTGFFRNLETNIRVVVPIREFVRFLISSEDVLHSFAIPSFGMKTDGCPGRVNQALIVVKRTGSYFGQCSEICGQNQGFMPMSLLGVKTMNLINTKKIFNVSGTVIRFLFRQQQHLLLLVLF